MHSPEGPAPDPAPAPQTQSNGKLIATKMVYTIVWAFLVASIVAVPMTA